MICEVCTTETH